MSGVLSVEALRLLRNEGVAEYESTAAGFRVRFFAPALPVPVEGKMPEATGERACACGHPLSEHNGQGLCLRGCAADGCEVTEET